MSQLSTTQLSPQFSTSELSRKHILATVTLLAIVAVFLIPSTLCAQAAATRAQVAPAAPDAALFTTYSGSLTTVDWEVCGSTIDTEGCYASGSIGPFNGVGAIVEGSPTVTGEDVVTRSIYVVDSGAADVTLYVYTKTDIITADNDTVTIVLSNTVPLSLNGGAGVVTSMAANDGYLFIGTSLTSQGIRVTKSSFRITKLSGFSPPIPVTSITSDEYGYVTVTQGSGDDTAYTVYGPDGLLQWDGGGYNFMLSTTQGLPVAGLLTGDGLPRDVRGVKKRSK